MRRRLRFLNIGLALPILLALIAGSLLISPLFRSASAQRGGVVAPVKGQPAGTQLSAAAKQQIRALLDEKASRTPAQRKMSSQLLYGMRTFRGQALTRGGEVRTMRSAETAAKSDARGRVEVEIKGQIDKVMIESVEKLGGEMRYASAVAGTLRARLPMESLEYLAELPTVKSIRPAMQARTHHQVDRGSFQLPVVLPFKIGPAPRVGARRSFSERAQQVRQQLSTALTRNAARPAQSQTQAIVGIASSEGDLAHGATAARNFFGVTGAGVKIGVLSDSVDFMAQSVASGDLPADVTVLPGQSGVPGNGEGTAMLEIVHDLAPGAKLYFATAFAGVESFADNIRALRAAGCDILVDDVIYANESPFHDDLVTTAVEEVTASGALYFSSAGNDGNFNDGTSSVWEGDFKDSGSTLAVLPGGTLHDFGTGVISNRAETQSQFILGLWWSDPLGASSNDYDLFIMDNTLSVVLDASTGVQDGDDDPFEATFPGAFAGERILVFKVDGAEKRALHVNNFGGELAISTPGSTHGHNSAVGAFNVAAIDASLAGGGSFVSGPTSPVELFSSDGFRRVFYKSDGTPFTPGNLTFSTSGGNLRRKPDLTAADGVSTSVPGFEQFFGTSAAAPHAAAIAALVKSAKPKLRPNRIRQALLSTALDIEATGADRDSGAGILDAFGALQSVGAPPSPYIDLGTVATTVAGGDGDIYIEPGEGGRISVSLANVGGATALGVRATLSTTTPGVTITAPTASYPNIGSNGQTATNAVPFAFTLSNNAACGVAIDFTLTVNYTNSNLGAQVFTFKVQTGQPDALGTTFSYAGPAVPIPDGSLLGVDVPITISGLTSPINGLKFRFDGTSCSSAIGATTVGLDHTWVGDLVVRLTSPQGTTVTLMVSPGGVLNSGNNFCNTVLDDSATALIQNISAIEAPFTGSFIPANPLSAFNGQNGNGTWILNVSDVAPADTGNVRAFSLVFSTFACSTP